MSVFSELKRLWWLLKGRVICASVGHGLDRFACGFDYGDKLHCACCHTTIDLRVGWPPLPNPLPPAPKPPAFDKVRW